MKHKQIIDKIGFKQLAESLEDDIVRLVTRAMSLKKGESIDNIQSYILPLLLSRWNCLLFEENGIAKYYKEKVYLTLATLLHKYGLSDETITNKAIEAINELNDKVVLSDDFHRKSSQIKDFLKTKPSELKRKPSRQKNITFFRENDIISINLNNKFYAAYIHKLTGVNEAPILEFYNKTFETLPKLEDITTKKARGEKFNDGKIRISKFAIYGMKYQPDLANQIHLIKSNENSEMKPDNNHLEESIGQFTISNLFTIQRTIKGIFTEQ